MNDAIVQRAPLVWEEGNPDARDANYLYGGISYTWMPMDRFNLSGTIYTAENFDPWKTLWDIAPEGKDGVIKKAVNDGTSNFTFISANAFWRATDFMTLRVKLMYRMGFLTGINKNDYKELQGSFNANFYIGNVTLGANLESPVTNFYRTGGSEGGFSKSDWTYGISAKYVLGDFSAEARFLNWFNKTDKTRIWFDSPHYSYEINSYSTGRYLGITLNYVISYGKKINRQIDEDRGEGMKSSVLGE